MSSLTPAEMALVVVSEPPTKVSAIISAWSSLSLSGRPHSSMTVFTSALSNESSGFSRSRSKIGWKIVLCFDFLANRDQFLVFRLHQANAVKERLGPLFDLPDIVGIGAHLLANDE